MAFDAGDDSMVTSDVGLPPALRGVLPKGPEVLQLDFEDGDVLGRRGNAWTQEGLDLGGTA